jgi:hypothetical protein
MMHRHRVILILLGLILIGLANHTLGDTEKVNIDSESALKHISGGWYDSQKNSYRPPVLSKPIDDTIRQSGWLGSKKAPSTPRKTTAPWSWSSLGISSELFGWIVFGTLGSVLLFGLLAIAYYYFGDYVPALRRKSSDKDSIKVDMTKVEDLPFEVSANNDDPLAYAEELMRLGRYNEAVVYLFGYMLLALDQSRKIHLQKGKTNRMYLREIRSETPLKEIVSKTMLAFEDVFFGRYDIDRARFEMLWAQRDEFHRLIRPVADSEVAPVAKIAPA